MLGLRYLEGNSNEERLAGLLLCLKEIESNPVSPDDTGPSPSAFEQILSRLSPLFIVQLVCTDQPAASTAGVTFLSLLPDALAVRFKEHNLLLLDNELRKDGSDGGPSNSLVFDFIFRSMKGSSPVEVNSLIEQALSRNRQLTSPTRLLCLVADLSRLLTAPAPLSSPAQGHLRDLATQCFYLPNSPHSLRSEALGAVRILLRTLDASWTVESPDDPRGIGTFARLLCSIVRGEMLLLLEHTLTSQGAQSTDTDSEEILVFCVDILETAITLLVGDEASESGPWAKLPYESLLHQRQV